MTAFLAALISAATLVAAADLPEASPPVPDPTGMWGWDAHRMICQMAWWRLDDGTRSSIDDLIDEDPGFDRFAESCLWADQVRGEVERYDRFTTAHYVNLPRGATAFDIERDCADTYCVVEAIRDMRSTLAEPSAPASERLDALKFLAHFVSDIHQPMHAGYGDDRGGNDTPVTLFGNGTNLHAAWDYGLLEHAGLPWVNFASMLYFDIRPDEARAWSEELDPATWAEESFAVVSGSAYDLPEDGAIGDTYYDRHIRLIERRMKQAAVRLAAILEETLGD